MGLKKWILGIALIALIAASAAYFETNHRRAKAAQSATPAEAEQGPMLQEPSDSAPSTERS